MSNEAQVLEYLEEVVNASPVIEPKRSAEPKFYQATCGRRRSFLSQRDADAYDAGYMAYPALPSHFGTPEATGYHDAHDKDQSRDDANLARGSRRAA